MAKLIGIATWNFSEGNLADRIERFIGMGYNAISLSARDAKALCAGQTPDVEEVIARHALAVAIHAGLAPTKEPVQTGELLDDFNLFASWHARTNSLVTIIYDAAKLKTDSGLVFQTEAMVNTVGQMLRISEGLGFTVGVEDWPRGDEQFDDAEALRRYPHYGILIDLGHLNFRVRKSLNYFDMPFPVEAARQYLDEIYLPVNELHIHNNDGKADLHAPPDAGTSDLMALARLLKEKGVDCLSTIELVPAWCGLSMQEGFAAASDALNYWSEAF
ncbi:MAG: hypothetical protein GX139_02985 [Armatimonadetes bacterium]|nr:hypothetical protein [Armatimonadota bacterium]